MNSSLSYRVESARPLTSLAFIAPMLVAYETGIFLFGADALRNGADAWLRTLLLQLGFGQYFLLPLLTCGILLGWHHVSRARWNIHGRHVGRMWIESLVFGAILIGIAQLLGFLFSGSLLRARLAVDNMPATVCGYFGAGIYEEVLFRLLLLPAIAGLLNWFGCSKRTCISWAVILSSLVFSAAHYQLISSAGDTFEYYSFTFRLLAGFFFALLFLKRGFGIAAGSHAMYDICTLAW